MLRDFIITFVPLLEFQGTKKAMKEYLELVNKQVDELVARVRSHLSKNDRRKFSTVLVIDVHARDVIEVFVRERSVAHSLSVSYCKTDLLTLVVYIRKHSNRFSCYSILNGKEFEWEMQMKYYWWKPADNLVVRQCTGTFRKLLSYVMLGISGFRRVVDENFTLLGCYVTNHPRRARIVPNIVQQILYCGSHLHINQMG